VYCQGLPFRREDREGERNRRRLLEAHDRQPIFRPGDVFLGDRDDIEIGHLLAALPDAAAIADHDVDRAAGEAGRHRIGFFRIRGGRAADDLPGFGVQRCKSAGTRLVDELEHRPGIVAARVGFGRRCAELDGWVEEALGESRRCELCFRLGEGAEPVAREHHGRGGPAVLAQLQRMAHIGRSEQIGLVARFDLFPHQAGRPECRAHGDAGLGGVFRRDRGQHVLQATGTVEHHLFRMGLYAGQEKQDREKAGHEDVLIALSARSARGAISGGT